MPGQLRRLSAIVVMAVALATLAGPPAVAEGDGEELQLSQEYIDSVNAALAERRDVWGEELIARPEGPTYENIKDYLVPVMIGGPYLTDSGVYYLPLGIPRNPDALDALPVDAPVDRDHYALHVADGGQIIADWRADCRTEYYTLLVYSPSAGRCVSHRKTTFMVGADATERFGSSLARLGEPSLYRGYLPALQVDYTDASGVQWRHESFATLIPQTDSLVSFVKFTARRGASGQDAARLRVNVADLQNSAALLTASGNKVGIGPATYLMFSEGGTWTSPNLDYSLDLSSGQPVSVYLAVLNNPTTVGERVVDEAGHEAARASLAAYWDTVLKQGATVEVPEQIVMDAMRSLLLQNITMGWKYSIGNFYEQFYVPENIDQLTPLSQFGYTELHRTALEQLLKKEDKNKGPAPLKYENWETGSKLKGAAEYYWLTGDDSLIRDHQERFTHYMARYQQQMATDPNGLLEKQRYAEDIPDIVYGTHHQAMAWRGMRDMAEIYRRIGEQEFGDAFANGARALKGALDRAVLQSQVTLDDGSIFIPVALLDGTAEPFDPISETRAGSYWNLVIHYAWASGMIPPDSPLADGILRYLHEHGSTFLGLTRFNYTGVPVGECNPYGLDGYKTTGADELYGYSYARFLADNDEVDRLLLKFYGKLAHGLTRGTFIMGEGETIGPCPQQGEYYRSTWDPPLGANNAVFLEALRKMLVRETVDDRGVPEDLVLTSATPRHWLADGERIAVDDLPTYFGPVSYELVSHLADGRVDVTVSLPDREPIDDAWMRVRVPAGHRMAGVTLDGRPYDGFDADDERIDLTGLTGTVRLQVRFVPVR